MGVSASSDPADLTIVEAVRAVRGGHLSAVELTAAVLDRAERLNGALNAYLYLDADKALEQARSIDARRHSGLLAGVPICVKDLIDVAGVATTAGSARWRRTPERDAAAVARLRESGAVIIGKGHTNEFAYGIDGCNPHWGDCRNPHDPRRLAGGSSSGPAVAVTTGLALAGLGTDTSGSIRVPASLCGLVGVRPTSGSVPLDGVVPLAWSYDTVGPLTRTVEDAQLVLRALTDGTRAKDDAPRDVRGLRLGILQQLVDAAEPYAAAAITRLLAQLEAAGAAVVPVRLERLRHVNAMHQIVQQAEAANAHEPWFEAQRRHYSEPVRLRLQAGRLLSAGDYLRAQQSRRMFIDEVTSAFRGLDALFAPSTPFVAPPLGSQEVTVRGERRDLRAALLECVLPASQLACPVIALPVGSHQGLPFGLQVIGRPFSEVQLFAIAAICEQAMPAPAPLEASRAPRPDLTQRTPDPPASPPDTRRTR
jgi:aspartyl-tRNA(Asn)/glutamyl-tRNA(Gln) amidotransferase subunit A